MIVKDLLPPILVRLVKGKKRFKEYVSYSEAMKVCTSDAYQNIEVCNMLADKTAVYIEALKKRPFSLNPTSVFLLSAINQYLNVRSEKNLRVLDFGDACGAHYFEIKRFIPNNVSLKWYVVETDQMIKSAIERGLNSDELHFVSSLGKIESEIDFIHNSGTLQYVPSPYKFLNILIKFKANWLFFNRMMFNAEDRTPLYKAR